MDLIFHPPKNVMGCQRLATPKTYRLSQNPAGYPIPNRKKAVFHLKTTHNF